MLGDVLECQMTPPLLGPASAEGDQLGNLSVSEPVRRPKNDRVGVDGSNLGADDQRELAFFGRPVSANDAGQAVAIGDRQGSQTERRRLFDKLIWV